MKDYTKIIINNQEDDLPEYYLGIFDLIRTFEAKGMILDNERTLLEIIHKWMRGEILAEMVILRGMMKKNNTHNQYFFYSRIGELLDLKHPLFYSHSELLIKRMSGIIDKIMAKEYNPIALEILKQVFEEISFSIEKSKYYTEQYPKNSEDDVIFINRIEYCIEEGFKLFSSTM